MSQRNTKRPKRECPFCQVWVRQLDKHVHQKHPPETWPTVLKTIIAV